LAKINPPCSAVSLR